MMTVDDDLPRWIELPQASREFTERNESPTEIDCFVLSRLADIEQEDALALVDPSLELVDAAVELDVA